MSARVNWVNWISIRRKYQIFARSFSRLLTAVNKLRSNVTVVITDAAIHPRAVFSARKYNTRESRVVRKVIVRVSAISPPPSPPFSSSFTEVTARLTTLSFNHSVTGGFNLRSRGAGSLDSISLQADTLLDVLHAHTPVHVYTAAGAYTYQRAQCAQTRCHH